MSELKIEKSDFNNEHSITSSNVLLCSETGRVIATFYNDYDLDAVVSIHTDIAKLEADKKDLQSRVAELESEVITAKNAIQANLEMTLKHASEAIELSVIDGDDAGWDIIQTMVRIISRAVKA